MDTIQFLESVLGDEGYYCLFAANKSTKQLTQKFYTSLNEVVQNANALDSQGYDAYFALGTFGTDKDRTAQNVKQLRALFLDIDCGEKKDYPTQKDGIVALQRFCKALHLPKPLMVNSGRGVHVYWRLENPVSVDEWLPVAERLKASCTAHGFNCDAVVTADAARILRLPQTHNHKDTPPKPTHLLGQFVPPPVNLASFNKLLVTATPSTETLFPLAKLNGIEFKDALGDKLAGNRQARFRTILKKTAEGNGCEQLKIIATDQENIDEPLWRAGLSIANECVDAEKGMRAISAKHPQYNEAEALAKMRRIAGPYLCDRFNEYNPDICSNCKHWGKIKTPIMLGSEVIEATAEDNVVRLAPENDPVVGELLLANDSDTGVAVIPSLPKPYFRGKNGGVYVREHDEEGNAIDAMIYKHDLYVISRIYDEEEGESVVFRLHLPRDGMREFTVAMTALVSGMEAVKELSYYGVVITQQNQRNVMGYIMTWVNELQESTLARNARRQFGWTKDHKSFVLGEEEYTRSGDILENPPSSVTMQYFPLFERRGTFEGWKQAMEFYNEPGMEIHQLVICAGFGSILMEFIDNVAAAGLHLYSTGSGHGKTTALFANNSIWGDYSRLTVQAEDTMAFAMHRGEVYKNLPLNVDEITNKDPDLLSDFVLQVTHGSQRGRMQGNANKERLRGEPWSLLTVTTGNVSLVERVSMYKRSIRAEAQRILEVNVDKIEFTSKAVTDDFNQLLANNFGHAGPLFVQDVLRNYDTVKKIVGQVQNRVDTSFGLASQNRFWSAWLTCSLAGGVLAKQWGLLPFDTARMFTAAKKIANQNMATVESEPDQAIAEMVSEYLMEHWGQILQINSTVQVRGGQGQVAKDQIASARRDPNQKIVARYEPDTRMVYIVLKPFRAWCVNQQCNYAETLELMKKELNATSTRIRMTKGTGVNMPASRVLSLHCDFLDVEFDPDPEAVSADG